MSIGLLSSNTTEGPQGVEVEGSLRKQVLFLCHPVSAFHKLKNIIVLTWYLSLPLFINVLWKWSITCYNYLLITFNQNASTQKHNFLARAHKAFQIRVHRVLFEGRIYDCNAAYILKVSSLPGRSEAFISIIVWTWAGTPFGYFRLRLEC